MFDSMTSLPAPEIAIASAPVSKWERERVAFAKLEKSLTESHNGQYVAIHDGQLVESGVDQIEVARKAYERFGYVPIYVGLVCDVPQRPTQVRSPRIARQ